ncbi:hypothetical protein PYW07_004189 [Mythimna separata]|uniref:Myeloid differentiation primary response protein MyD88 n=1 Tax=Mythimna separata TaxID=271217 RepID=A0AAD7YQE1_MYTSE|nr:hypothetical protein PYW07_004189 [Mythimna separata]
MVDYSDIIQSMPLSCLPLKTRELLSCLLDTPKIIPNDAPDKLPRDWRGLASLVNVSAEKASYIALRPQKTAEVLEIWQKDPTATVGQLLSYLEHLDRFDVYDDLYDDLKEAITREGPLNNRQNQIAINNNNNNISHSVDKEKVTSSITYDDEPGFEQHYDAFVLYAKEDKKFVDELLTRMGAAGFQLCTEDRLQAGHMTPYAPVAQLISERCKRIILVYSPEFLSSQANTFYRDYAQAVSIESSYHKIIPIMYRECVLPSHLAFYHKLYYNEDERAMYDFWLKLKQSLEIARHTPRPQYNNRINNTTMNTSLPQIKIVELQSSKNIHDYMTDNNNLFLPSPHKSISMNDLDSLNVHNLTADCNSLSSMSQKSVSSGKKKKKFKIVRRFMKYLKITKPEEAIMVAH